MASAPSRSSARSGGRCATTLARWHWGIIIAVVEFLRAVLAYIDNKTKQLQEKNKALKIAFKVRAAGLGSGSLVAISVRTAKHMFYETVWKVQFI